MIRGCIMEWIKGVSCIISIAVVVWCTIWNAGRYQITGMGEEPAAKQGSVGGWFRYSGPTRPNTDHNQLSAHLQSVTPPVWDWRTHPPRLKIGLPHTTWKGEQVERGGRWKHPPAPPPHPPNTILPVSRATTCVPATVSQAGFQGCPSWGIKLDASRAARRAPHWLKTKKI